MRMDANGHEWKRNMEKGFQTPFCGGWVTGTCQTRVSCHVRRESRASVGAYLKWRMRRRLGDALHGEEWGLSGYRAGSGSSFRDDEGSGDAGVEGGELEAVLFREGKKVGVGGVFGVSALGGEVPAGGEIVGEEVVACLQEVHEFAESSRCHFDSCALRVPKHGNAHEAELHDGRRGQPPFTRADDHRDPPIHAQVVRVIRPRPCHECIHIEQMGNGKSESISLTDSRLRGM